MNLPLVSLYAGTVLASLALAATIYAVTQARTHIKAHGVVGGLMEWWLYGRQSNWEEIPTPADIYSIRLNSVELEHLSAGAAKRGLTLGQYIKRAAIQQAADDHWVESVTATTGYGHILAGRVPPA